MKSKKGLIHQIAHCQTCNWKCEKYEGQAARKEGYSHAKKTGHRVIVETGLFITYNP